MIKEVRRAFCGVDSVFPVVFRRFFGVEARFEAYLSAGRCFRALGGHQSLRLSVVGASAELRDEAKASGPAVSEERQKLR